MSGLESYSRNNAGRMHLSGATLDNSVVADIIDWHKRLENQRSSLKETSYFALVASKCKVCANTAKKYITSYDEGELNTLLHKSKLSEGKGSRVLDLIDMACLFESVERNPRFSLVRHCEFLRSTTGTIIAPSTLCGFFKEAGLTLGKTTQLPLEKFLVENTARLIEYLALIKQFPLEKIQFIDETHKDELVFQDRKAKHT